MENRIYYSELECYKQARQSLLRSIGKGDFIDLSALPTKTMREEYRQYFLHRGFRVSLNTIKHEKSYFNQVCMAIQLRRKVPDSFRDWEHIKWIQLLEMWMLQNGVPLYREVKNVTGKISRVDAPAIQFLKNFLLFLYFEDEQPEQEKDIWRLAKLDIPIKENPIYKTHTLNSTGIQQSGIREEVKRAIYQHLRYEKLGTVKRELTSLWQFSRYLQEKQIQIQSCSEIDRQLLEDYLTYKATNGSSGHSNSDDILKLRAVVETVGNIFGYQNLEKLFINTDIPPEVQPEFRAYSDVELKRLNAQITKLDVQIARCMVIHQMLGTRISDTLTLRRDCLSKRNGLDIIRIQQVKSRTYEKPISVDLAALIQKAISYSIEHYGESDYIFVDDKDTSRPLQYATIKYRILVLIHEEKLCDDEGKPFTFSSYMFRRSYGVKLTELHLDDWTIAKLLGHKNVRAVKHYRKMSNQLLADETRRARAEQTRILFKNLDGWGEDYEQIRQND